MTELCPICNNPLESGYLVGGTLIRWCKSRPRVIGRCGEGLATGWWGPAALQGRRCKMCKLIIYID